MDRNLSTLLVDSKENNKLVQNHRRYLVQQLQAIGVPAQEARNLGMDVYWSVGGRACMFDLKTPSDLIASVNDGRLHDQITRAQNLDCMLYGILIEGRVSEDGVMVGYGPHAWSFERFDNLLLTLQEEGARVVYATTPERTAARLKALYHYSAKTTHGSYHTPSPNRELRNLYTDKTYRRQVEMLMSLPEMGEVRANELLDRWPLTAILGITPDGLEEAKVRWASVRGIGPKTVAAWERFLLDDFSWTPR